MIVFPNGIGGKQPPIPRLLGLSDDEKLIIIVREPLTLGQFMPVMASAARTWTVLKLT